MDADTEFMQQALAEAREAAASGEVPIGAVLVHERRIIARAGNRTIRDCDPTAHAEIVGAARGGTGAWELPTGGYNFVRDDRTVQYVRGSDDPGAGGSTGLWSG